jgi:hypothetical protein
MERKVSQTFTRCGTDLIVEIDEDEIELQSGPYETWRRGVSWEDSAVKPGAREVAPGFTF